METERTRRRGERLDIRLVHVLGPLFGAGVGWGLVLVGFGLGMAGAQGRALSVYFVSVFAAAVVLGLVHPLAVAGAIVVVTVLFLGPFSGGFLGLLTLLVLGGLLGWGVREEIREARAER